MNLFKNLDAAVTQDFKMAYQQGAISHSYLFVSGDNELAMNTATWLSCLFLCDNPDEENRPDGICRNCQRVISQNHPDVFLVEELEKQSLGIDAIRPLKEELAKSPLEGSRRFFIINDAQKLTLPAANALLNLLEEPVAPVVSILITNNVNQILPTIVSRTQIVNFTAKETEKSKLVRDLGLSSSDLSQIDDEELEQIDELLIKFYEHVISKNKQTILSLKRLLDLNLNRAQQSFVLARLQQLADQRLHQNENLNLNQKFLTTLFKVNQMRASNVSFASCLNYLILTMEF